MDSKYQVVIFGDSSSARGTLESKLRTRFEELGIDGQHLVIIDRENFDSDYKNSSPSIGVYFGSSSTSKSDESILQRLQRDATVIIPVVSGIEKYTTLVPAQLYAINGFESQEDPDFEKLVGVILEGLRLLRVTRRAFISYKRGDSSSIAIQLFEALEKSGFDVFLDTHSIRPGDTFQDELWHRLADSDIVILLNSPNFMASKWTREELAKASAMSIGIVQVLWPGQLLDRESQICLPICLTDADFDDGTFKAECLFSNDTIKNIIRSAESLRARSIAARHDNLVSNFVGFARRINRPTAVHRGRFITVTGNVKSYLVIPSVGVPQSITYNDIQDASGGFPAEMVHAAYLLYDHICIRDKWLQHLTWLDTHLPIKSVKISESESWLKAL